MNAMPSADNHSVAIYDIGPGIWSIPNPLSLGPIQLNTRMTVIQLADGGLVLISPVTATDALRQAIDKIGPVVAIVAPSQLHHLFVSEWTSAYPDALSFGCEGLVDKRPDLQFAHLLGTAFDTLVGTTLQRYPIGGMPKVTETLFYHPPSRSLIVTDFCFYMPNASGWTWLYAKLMGFHSSVRCSPVFKMMIKDKSAFRNSLTPLRHLDVQQMIMCHHHALTEDAQGTLDAVLDALRVPLKDHG